jgi:hypothetical protein
MRVPKFWRSRRVFDQLLRLIDNNQTAVHDRSYLEELRLSLLRPGMYLAKVPTLMLGRGVENDLVPYTFPFHRRQIGVALERFPQLVDAVAFDKLSALLRQAQVI